MIVHDVVGSTGAWEVTATTEPTEMFLNWWVVVSEGVGVAVGACCVEEVVVADAAVVDGVGLEQHVRRTFGGEHTGVSSVVVLESCVVDPHLGVEEFGFADGLE